MDGQVMLSVSRPIAFVVCSFAQIPCCTINQSEPTLLLIPNLLVPIFTYIYTKCRQRRKLVIRKTIQRMHRPVLRLNADRCRPKKCHQECKKSCPVVKLGKLCIEVDGKSKLAFISEPLCIGTYSVVQMSHN